MNRSWATFLKPCRPLVMAVLNLTTDSFYPHSRVTSRDAGFFQQQVALFIQQGADILDLGAESSRPGAVYVSESEELARLLPAIQCIREFSDIPLSIDTRRARVAELALSAGADIINDISAGLDDDGQIFQVVARHQCPLVLMHMQGNPQTMQVAPEYQDVVAEVKSFLALRVEVARDHGIQHLILDPGLGFGKTLQHNLQLVAAIKNFDHNGLPVLIGHSRKAFIGQILANASEPRPVEQRLAGSLAVAVWAAVQGVAIIRTHDVAETADLVRVISAIQREVVHA